MLKAMSSPPPLSTTISTRTVTSDLSAPPSSSPPPPPNLHGMDTLHASGSSSGIRPEWDTLAEG